MIKAHDFLKSLETLLYTLQEMIGKQRICLLVSSVQRTLHNILTIDFEKIFDKSKNYKATSEGEDFQTCLILPLKVECVHV